MESNDTNAFGMEGYDASTYGDSFADVYDEWYADLDDSDFIEWIVGGLTHDPARILELGVGTGRLARRLLYLRDGCADHLFGIDSSDKMLDVARRRLEGRNVTLVHGDFSTRFPEGRYDAVFVGYNTLFNLPDEASVEACFALVARHLAPGGSFFVDAVAPVSREGGDDVSVRTMSTGEVVLSITRHETDAQRITGQFVQFSDGEKVTLRPWVVRYFTPLQLDQIAERAGLRLVGRFADGTGTAYTPESRRHVSEYGAK